MREALRSRDMRRLGGLVLIVFAVAGCDFLSPSTGPASPPASASGAASPDQAGPGAPSTSVIVTRAPSPSPSRTPTPRPSRTPTPPPSPAPVASPSPTPKATTAANDFAACPGSAPSGHPTGALARSTSRNWAGYVAALPAGGVTCVEAVWVEPKVRCPAAAFRAVAIWVGIGGYDQGALVQLGTESSCRLGEAVSVSWRESLPQERTVVGTGLHIRPGHRIHAQVRWIKSSRYRLSMANLSNGETFSITVTNKSVKRTSAEWIVEAPATTCSASCRILSMPRFTTVAFSSVWSTWRGVRQPLDGEAFVHDRVRMVTAGGNTRAEVTSTGASGTTFKVTYRRP